MRRRPEATYISRARATGQVRSGRWKEKPFGSWSTLEAPEGSDLLGDLETKELNRLEFVKNDLRNRTARLGGDLIVLDGIQQEVREGQTWAAISGPDEPYKMAIPPIR
ncbi:MAG: DUF4156 domain-containing protein [Candidatus Moduliflexus flocculans]|nr:DUF4156 domain-containing protein [Candidatus Moduliflexus flocculans]